MTARRGERGSGLAVILLLAGSLLLTLGLVATAMGILLQRAARRGGEVQALAVAEAGVEKGIAAFKLSPSYHGETLRLEGGLAVVELRHVPGGMVEITSRGRTKGWTKSVRIRGWRNPELKSFLIVDWQEGR